MDPVTLAAILVVVTITMILSFAAFFFSYARRRQAFDKFMSEDNSREQTAGCRRGRSYDHEQTQSPQPVYAAPPREGEKGEPAFQQGGAPGYTVLQ